MIYPSLTDAQMKRSQRFFIAYNLLNGLGYLCVSDMVMLFIINQLGLPDVVFTILAQMMNFGCIWLPLGKISTERWGAARTQGNFWFLRNIAAVIMGSCAIWGVLGHPYIAIGFLLGGAFLFYGCRSAGNVMSTALVGNITHENERGKLLAFASMAHQIVSAVFTIALTVLLHYVSSIWALFGIVVFGASCGILSSVCLWNIDESSAIQEAAKKPLLADAWVCLKDSGFRRMVIAQLCFSIAMALTMSLNMLVMTRGIGVSKSFAMGISFVGSMMCVAFARPAAALGDKLGPRKALIISYCFAFLLILYWQLVPETYTWYPMVILPIKFSPALLVAVFFLIILSPFYAMSCGICTGQYFLKCIPVEHQPSAATLQSLINGVLTGFLTTAITAFLWKICDWRIGVDVICMARYRLFFLLALPIVALGLIGVWMQKEV